MTAIRIVALIAWSGLLLYMVPGAISAIRAKSSRHGDPMRAGVLFTAIVFVGFIVRSLWAPTDQTSWFWLYVLCVINAAYIARLAYTYGRGPKR
jgi:hypothetical protein